MKYTDLKIPSLVFIFGLAGAGKSFAAEMLGRMSGAHVHDFEGELTPAMKGAIERGESFTEPMRDEFFAFLCGRLSELRAKHRPLIVSQGAYKERHRAMIRAAHPDVVFVWIRASDEILYPRIERRTVGVSAEFARTIAPNFEPPDEAVITLDNDGTPEELSDALAEAFGAAGSAVR